MNDYSQGQGMPRYPDQRDQRQPQSRRPQYRPQDFRGPSDRQRPNYGPQYAPQQAPGPRLQARQVPQPRQGNPNMRGPAGPPPQQQQQQRSQWPLVNDYEPPTEQRRAPPQRPPRPNQTPVVLPAARTMSNRGPPAAIPQYAQAASKTARVENHSPGVWTDDGYASASPTNPSRPLTGSSYASTSSSYSLPDDAPPMPQPPPAVIASQAQAQAQAQARARAPLGPPPSARRGPPSYYPQQNHIQVTPIVEETDSQRGSFRNAAGSRSSYASSNAIPIGVPDYYLNNRSEEHMPMEPPQAMQADYPRDESPSLVRHASLGKRSKPTLTTIKSAEPLRPGMLRAQSQSSIDDMYNEKSFEGENATVGRRGSSGVLGKEALYSGDRSSSESERSDYNRMVRSKDYLSEPMPPLDARAATTTSPASTADPRVESILGRLEKGGAIASENPSANPSSLAKRVGSRRPARLNVDAVKEAEQRGSLTSLPDLIKRATKLASNLDRGRTASRLGFNWMDNEKAAPNARENRRSGSLSDMLSAFPPPVLGTPGSGRGHGWPSPSRLRHHSALPSEDGGEAKNQRRCCGMRPWIFIVLLLLLLLLIAAAVIVPIVLIVLPREHSSASQLATCQKTLTCANGGINIVGSGGHCQCLCVNGFTGATCSTGSTSGCTTTAVNGNSDATVGDSLPRLLTGAQANFSIALDSQSILGLFSSSNLSCASENALVAFNGASEKRSLNVLDGWEIREATPVNRDLVASKTLEARAAVTSNGIVFATGSPTGSGTTPSSSSSSSSSSNSTTSDNSTLVADLDFARVAVLFVLQDSAQLNNAIEAQEALQSYFTSGDTSTGEAVNPSNITLQNGYTVNIERHTLVVPNGTTIG